MNWNFDLSQAPRDGSHVILAMPNKTTVKSYWCKPKLDPEHWCMLSHTSEPVAWMPWPEHPFTAASQGETATTSARSETAEYTQRSSANTGGEDVTDGENAHLTSAGEHIERSPAPILPVTKQIIDKAAIRAEVAALLANENLPIIDGVGSV